MAKSQIDLGDLTPDEPSEGDGPKRKSAPRRSASPRKDNELKGRLAACFERIAAALEERGDEELAEIVREDGPIMSQGLVSLTRPFAALRAPLLLLIAVIEPVMAFGRIFRVMAGRFAMRRAMAAAIAEDEAAQAAQQE